MFVYFFYCSLSFFSLIQINRKTSSWNKSVPNRHAQPLTFCDFHSSSPFFIFCFLIRETFSSISTDRGWKKKWKAIFYSWVSIVFDQWKSTLHWHLILSFLSSSSFHHWQETDQHLFHFSLNFNKLTIFSIRDSILTSFFYIESSFTFFNLPLTLSIEWSSQIMYCWYSTRSSHSDGIVICLSIVLVR